MSKVIETKLLHQLEALDKAYGLAKETGVGVESAKQALVETMKYSIELLKRAGAWR